MFSEQRRVIWLQKGERTQNVGTNLRPRSYSFSQCHPLSRIQSMEIRVHYCKVKFQFLFLLCLMEKAYWFSKLLKMFKVLWNCYFPFRLPPGPTGLPFLSVVNKLDPLQVWQTIQQWKDQYGDIYLFTLPGQHVVVVSLSLKQYNNGRINTETSTCSHFLDNM